MKPADTLSIQRTALALRGFAAPAGDPAAGQVVLVTSARAGEGKSFIAGLLARALAAQRDGEVLLAEAGQGGELDPLGSGAGLRGLLDGAAPDEIVKPVEKQPGLWRLPRGDGFDAAHLFQAGRLRAALAVLRQRYAITLIDGPQLAATGALLALTDRSVLVVDASRTPGPVVRAALDAAMGVAQVPAGHMAGVVLNRRAAAMPRWLAG